MNEQKEDKMTTIRRGTRRLGERLLLGCIGLLMYSCSDFLKEEDKDKVIPRTMEQFESMLHREGFLDVTWFYKSEFMTDDVQENTPVVTTAKNRYKGLYTWQYDVERTGEGDFADGNNDVWGKLYNDILVANYILERSADIVDADTKQARKSQLEGEAHFLRARAYLELVNVYAEPYDPATAASMPGVPLREGTGITNRYQRNTVAEVYAQIEDDLKAAIELLGKADMDVSLWHPTQKAALLLLSRTYLYMNELQKTVSTASQVIDLCPQGLYAMNKNITSAIVRVGNPEVLHTWGEIAGTLVENAMEGVQSEIPKIYRVESSFSTAAYGVSDDLLSMYSPNDVRPLLYFHATGGMNVTGKWHPQFTQLGGNSLRLSEAYLNRAEANAALGNTDAAMADMKVLLAKRIDGDYSSLLPVGDNAMTVRRFVLDQRRMELCFEGQRWFDLRRSQSWYPKDVEHTFSYSTSTSGTIGTVNETEVYVLRSGSPNYTIELPLAETTVNPNIEMYSKREQIVGRKK